MTVLHMQRRETLTIDALDALDVRRPDIQRDVDEDRIAEIVSYQLSALERYDETVFLGDIVLGVDSDRLHWIVDGQHRFGAMMQLKQQLGSRAGKQLVSVTFVRLDARFTLQHAFELVNKSVPVPQHVIAAMTHEYEDRILKGFAHRFKEAFRPFIVTSACPRKPNVNLQHILDRMFQTGRIAAFGSAGELFDRALEMNSRFEQLADDEFRDKVNDKLRKAPGSSKSKTYTPLFLSLDPECEWVTDDDPRVATRRRAGARKPLPQSVRYDVWNRDVGEKHAFGCCTVCTRRISIQSFHVGHIVAVANGGTDNIDNLCVLCSACNLAMGTTDLNEFRMRYYG